MKTYEIPINFMGYKTYEVSAETLQEAVEEALKMFFNDPLTEFNYIEDSFEIDGIVDDNYPNETFDY